MKYRSEAGKADPGRTPARDVSGRMTGEQGANEAAQPVGRSAPSQAEGAALGQKVEHEWAMLTGLMRRYNG